MALIKNIVAALSALAVLSASVTASAASSTPDSPTVDNSAAAAALLPMLPGLEAALTPITAPDRNVRFGGLAANTDTDGALAQTEGGFPYLIVFVVVAVGLGIYAVTSDDGPTSP